MVNIEGYVCHIDFGFLLSNAPGKGMKFETLELAFEEVIRDEFLLSLCLDNVSLVIMNES